MSVFDTRGALLRTSAVAALLTLGATAASASTVVSGGSTLAGPTYQKIFKDAIPLLRTPPTYSCTSSVDICYAFVGSGAGTTGFLNNDSTQLGLAAGIPVDFGAADAILSTSQVTAFQSAHTYQLDELPAFGTPVTIPFNYAGKTNNAAIKLKDADLCGIFSGKIQDWSKVSQTGLSGSIAVAYREDGSGTSFLLTNRLGAVCTAGNSSTAFVAALAANKAAAARTGNDGGTTKFATLFTGYTTGTDSSGKTVYFVPAGTFATPLPGNGSGAVQLNVVTNAKSVGYIGPDYTEIAAVPTLAAGVTKAPYVASVNNTLPTITNTQAALNSAPSNPVATNPDSFGILVPKPTKAGSYPIVGYTYLYLSSCYSSSAKVTIVKNYLDTLYNVSGTNTQAVADIKNSGFVPLTAKLLKAVESGYLAANATVPFITTGQNIRPNVPCVAGR